QGLLANTAGDKSTAVAALTESLSGDLARWQQLGAEELLLSLQGHPAACKVCHKPAHYLMGGEVPLCAGCRALMEDPERCRLWVAGTRNAKSEPLFLAMGAGPHIVVPKQKPVELSSPLPEAALLAKLEPGLRDRVISLGPLSGETLRQAMLTEPSTR